MSGSPTYHNALEFADVREGAPYEGEFEGNVVSPLAHVAMHAAVKRPIEQVPEVRTAFENMMATGTPAHHAGHVLAALVGAGATPMQYSLHLRLEGPL